MIMISNIMKMSVINNILMKIIIIWKINNENISNNVCQ